MHRSEAVAIAREEHALKIDAEVPAAREMVARLVERRAQEIAAGKGTANRLSRTTSPSDTGRATTGRGRRAAGRPSSSWRA